MKSEIFKNLGTIIIYVLAILVLLAIIGYNYWGWFGGKTPCIGCGNPIPDNNGFPNNPKIGDKFSKNGKMYIYTSMAGIQCITAPCYDAMWLPYESGGSSINQYVENNSSDRMMRPTLFYSNGNPVNSLNPKNPATMETKPDDCESGAMHLEQYPLGSQWHPYYKWVCDKPIR